MPVRAVRSGEIDNETPVDELQGLLNVEGRLSDDQAAALLKIAQVLRRDDFLNTLQPFVQNGRIHLSAMLLQKPVAQDRLSRLGIKEQVIIDVI